MEKLDSNKRKKRDACEICFKKYSGVFVTEHVCKRCFRSVCKDCADKKGPIFSISQVKKEDHRICSLCWSEIQFIKAYIKDNSISLNTLSTKGKEWFDIIVEEVKQIQENYRKSVQVSRNSQIGSKSAGKECWRQLNFSIRDFIGSVTAKSANFLETVDELYMKISMSEDLKTQLSQHGAQKIILYVLAHAHEMASLKIVSFLFKMVKRFSIENVFRNLEILQKSQDKLKMLKSYAKNSEKQFTNSFGIDWLRLEVVNEIISETIITNSPHQLEAAFAYVIWSNQQVILNSSIENSEVRREILLKTTGKIIEKGIKLIRSKKVVSQVEQKEKSSPVKPPKKQEKMFEKKPTKIAQFHQNFSEGLQDPSQDRVDEKLDQALMLIQRIESAQVNPDGSFKPENLDDLDRYLDMVIQDNQKGLKEMEELEDTIGEVSNRLNLVRQP